MCIVSVFARSVLCKVREERDMWRMHRTEGKRQRKRRHRYELVLQTDRQTDGQTERTDRQRGRTDRTDRQTDIDRQTVKTESDW